MSTSNPTSNVAVVGDVLNVNGSSLPLSSVLGVETGEAENPARTALLLFTGLFGPILSMIVFTVCQVPAARFGLGLLFAALPFVGLVVALAWKRPWGVIVELPTTYRCLYQTADKAAADAVTATIRGALKH